MKKILSMVLLLAALVVTAYLLSGCNAFEVDGPRLANDSPVIYWSDFPQDSLAYRRNPELFWYGTDTDGQLTALDYQYIVLVKDTVDAHGGALQMSDNFPAGYEWTSVGNITNGTVPLFASPDTSVFIDQYVFMRCQDAHEAVSNIIFLYLSRNNHAPTCIITVPGTPQWCLPDTNDFWHGISVNWEGKDSIDYTGIQPDFIWKTRVFGPFADSASADTTSNWLYTLADPVTGDTLTSLEEYTFTNLETGWYIVETRNYDDASVSAIPALGYLNIYEPRWIRHDDYVPILIVDHNRFFSTPRFGEMRNVYDDSVKLFFDDAMAAAGFTDADYDWFDANDDAPVPVDISVLYNYKLVIATDIDYNNKISDAQQERYSRYLNVGGMMWIVGRRSFVSPSINGRSDYGVAGENILAYNYMDLSATYEASMALRDSAEFSGATPIIAGFPFLEVDTLRVSYTSWPANHYAEALLGIGYSIRNPNSETVYRFRSINPYTSRFDGFPVATRYDSGVFKTSYFAFPLYFIKEQQAFQVVEEMTNWFLGN